MTDYSESLEITFRASSVMNSLKGDRILRSLGSPNCDCNSNILEFLRYLERDWIWGWITFKSCCWYYDWQF